jgi:ABC-2 type transport system ATP-binding protein
MTAPMQAPIAALEAEHLVYRYPGQGRNALDGVGLRLVPGRAVGLLGPNGSGKSTLIGLLMGLRQPQGGSVRRPDPARTVVACVPQEYAFYPDLTCLENLRFYAGLLNVDKAEAARRVSSAVDSCMLEAFAHQRARHCSGGMRRRLNLAIALLQKPDVLLLDEPTVGVDPQSRSFLLERIRELVNGGTAVLYATHYMEEVSSACDDILLIDQGRVLASGDIAGLMQGQDGRPRFADLESLFLHYTQSSESINHA